MILQVGGVVVDDIPGGGSGVVDDIPGGGCGCG